MLSLIKIRSQYLKRHLCAVYCAYLFIPTLMSILLIGLFLFKRETYKDGLKTPGGERFTFSLFDEKEFEINYFFAILAETQEDCDIITSITNNIQCKTKESDINSNNTFKILNKDGKYQITLTQYGNDTDIIFPISDISTDKTVDLFQVQNFKNFNASESNYYKLFLYFQSLFAKFLIKKQKQTLNKNILIEIARNAYPPHTNYKPSNESILINICYYIAIQFSLTAYFFNMRMIDEKEKKLTSLLERQGITKKQYLLSWFLSYLLLAIIPTIIFIICYIGYIFSHFFLFLLVYILFLLNLFSFIYLFYISISTSKTASIVLKIIYFTPAFLGIIFIYPIFPKIGKILFSLFPFVNLYLSINSINKLVFFNKLSWEKIWLKANGMSFMENLILNLFDIFIYLFLAIFIDKYKHS